LAVLVILVMLKDTVGSAAPLLKKPLDAIEVLVVNKAALLFAVFPVVWHETRSVSALPSRGLLPDGLLATVNAAAPGVPAPSSGAIPMELALSRDLPSPSPSGSPAMLSIFSPY
jgi:hypothetical protein